MKRPRTEDNTPAPSEPARGSSSSGHRVGEPMAMTVNDCVSLRWADRVTPATPFGRATGAAVPFAAAAAGHHPITGIFVDPESRELLVRLTVAAAGAQSSKGHVLVPLAKMKEQYPQLLIDHLLSCAVYR